MALMNWNDYFVTGIPLIDEQHRRLVDLVNECAPALALDREDNPAATGAVLDALTDYAAYHFDCEEGLMREQGIDPDYCAQHHAIHRHFVDDIKSLRQRYESGDGLNGGDLLVFLANWLVFHILGEDQKLALQLHARQAGESPESALKRMQLMPAEFTNRALSHALVDLYTLMTEQNRDLLLMNRELTAHRETLESEVARRTRDLSAARDAAEAANRARSSFIANLSHEIRTPMNAIIGLTWTLHEQAPDEEQKGKLQQVIHATQQLLGIINDLLDLSRIESEQLALEPVNFNPHQLVDRLIADSSSRAQQKGLDLVTELPNRLPSLLQGDAVQISRILSNFLSNAIKFTTTGSVKLILRLEDHGDDHVAHLYFAVQDTGIGIPAAQCVRLFQPFEQLEQSTRRRFGGTGLGLAISRKLAEMMGGKVGVISHVDTGSIFWLRLPLVVPEHGQSMTGYQPVAPSTSTTVPLTADNPGAHELLRKLACLLAEDDVLSVALWREAASILKPMLGQRAERLEGDILSYNFESALRLVEAALAEENS